MSNSPRSDGFPSLDRLPTLGAPRLLSRPLTGVAFWAAIVLPFLHLPLLVTGLETMRMTIAFLVLLSLNVVALVIGHGYRSD